MGQAHLHQLGTEKIPGPNHYNHRQQTETEITAGDVAERPDLFLTLDLNPRPDLRPLQGQEGVYHNIQIVSRVKILKGKKCSKTKSIKYRENN